MPKEVRIKVWFDTYLIWNKHLEFGGGTSNEDLWYGGYEFRAFSPFGKPIAIIANKR